MHVTRLFLLVFTTFTSTIVSGQATYSTLSPASSIYALSQNIQEVKLDVAPDDLHQDQDANGPLHIGNQLPFQLNSQQDGLWETDQNGDQVWRAKIIVKGVRAIGFLFSRLELPEGGRLYVLHQNGAVYKGPWTNKNIANSSYNTPILKGNAFILEYNAPPAAEKPIIEISHAAAYFDDVIPETRQPEMNASRNFGESGNCQVNVNCPEGDNWRDQRRATVRIILTNGGSSYACTGTLMNNSLQDCHPYILTADHCIVDIDGNVPTATDYDQWIFYFDYESEDCDNPLQEGNLADNTSVGCDMVVRSGTAGEEDSDFLLLELDNPTDLSFFDVHFAGWDRRNTFSVSGAVPHHPSADIKKIATYSQPAESDTWGGSVLGTHWSVNWASTVNGQSVMEQGSSGASLFSAAGLAVGTLTGGSSNCNSGGGQGPNQPDLFGKMTYHFNHSSSSVRPYLDASGSGRTYIPGIDFPCTEDPLSVSSEQFLKDIRVFPTPVKGRTFYISGKGLKDPKFRLFDLGGKEYSLTSSKSGADNYNVQMVSCPAGVYVLEIHENQSRTYRKIVVQ